MRHSRARLLWLVLTVLMLVPRPALAAGVQYVKLEERRLTDHIEVRLQNLTTMEVTVTLEFDVAQNVDVTPRAPLTRVLPAAADEEVCQIAFPTDGSRWQYHFNYHYHLGANTGRHDDSAEYRLPFASGRSYYVLQGYGGTFSHQGKDFNALDFRMPIGTEVHAAREGEVVMTVDQFTEGRPDRELMNSCNRIIVKHADGTYGDYAHLKRGGIAVQVGQQVRAGDLLGYSGNTGFTTEPHLHFIVFRVIDGKRSESIPVRYVVEGASEPIVPRQGETYTAP